MGIIISFIKLSSREKFLALESLLWVIIIRIMVWVFPFAFVKKSVQKIATSISNKNPDQRTPMRDIGAMIAGVSTYIPQATCLVQAMAGYILFSRYGYNTRIKIGVLNEEGIFEAHAWLEQEGSVVLGESEKNYKTILDIDKN